MIKDRKGWIEAFAIGAIIVFSFQLAGCGSKEKLSPPVSPTNLQATAVSSSRIDLSWTDNSDDEDGFKIERKDSDGTYSLIVDFLQKTIDDSGVIAFIAENSENKRSVEKALNNAMGALRGRELRKVGISDNPLCMVIAIVLEAIQQNFK